MIKNALLGGVDRLNGEPADAIYQNETENAIINAALKGQAQIPFSILKSAGAFTNEGHLCADRTTDANGVNNTINAVPTLDSTSSGGENVFNTTIPFYDGRALFNINKYMSGFNLLASSDTTHNPNSFINPDNAFNTTTTNYTNLTVGTGEFDIAFGKTFTAKYIGWVYYGFSFFTGTSNSRVVNAYIETYNGTSWSVHTTLISGLNSRGKGIINYIYIGASVSGVRLRLTGESDDVELVTYIYYLNYGNYSTSNVIADTGTLNLDGTENSLTLYNDAVIPINTSMSVVVSDGTNSTSSYPLGAKTSIVIPISSLSSGTLKITFTLATTDVTKTPEWSGYGVVIAK